MLLDDRAADTVASYGASANCITAASHGVGDAKTSARWAMKAFTLGLLRRLSGQRAVMLERGRRNFAQKRHQLPSSHIGRGHECGRDANAAPAAITAATASLLSVITPFQRTLTSHEGPAEGLTRTLESEVHAVMFREILATLRRAAPRQVVGRGKGANTVRC